MTSKISWDETALMRFEDDGGFVPAEYDTDDSSFHHDEEHWTQRNRAMATARRWIERIMSYQHTRRSVH